MEVEAILAEQIAYYRALAPTYLDQAIGGFEIDRAAAEIETALDAFAPTGDVLELACGPGTWTPQLLRHASSVTAVDASGEMLALARERVAGDPRVRFIAADIFSWRPDRRYDVVFFGFWLSHVPPERLAPFFSLVDACLVPGGRVFFADDSYRTPEERPDGAVVHRQLMGAEHRLIKTPHTAASLQALLDGLGWRIEVRQTSSLFYWGSGVRGA